MSDEREVSESARTLSPREALRRRRLMEEASRGGVSVAEVSAEPPAEPSAEPSASLEAAVGPVASAPGFMSWVDYCNRVAVEIALNPMWSTRLGQAKGATLSQMRAAMLARPGTGMVSDHPLYSVMRRSYLVMKTIADLGAMEPTE